MNLAHFPNIIFDMDGVIIDSEPLQVSAEKHVCSNNRLHVPNHEWLTFKGKTHRDIFDYIIRTYGDDSMSVDALIEQKRTYVKRHLHNVKLIPGILGLLSHLRNFRPAKKIALTTSNVRAIQEMVFDRMHLDMYFDKIVTGDDVKNGKPDPEPYIFTTQQLRARAEQCVVIEDSDNGIRSAKAAGCYAVGITTSFTREHLLVAGADFVVDSHEALKGLFS